MKLKYSARFEKFFQDFQEKNNIREKWKKKQKENSFFYFLFILGFSVF